MDAKSFDEGVHRDLIYERRWFELPLGLIKHLHFVTKVLTRASVVIQLHSCLGCPSLAGKLRQFVEIIEMTVELSPLSAVTNSQCVRVGWSA